MDQIPTVTVSGAAAHDAKADGGLFVLSFVFALLVAVVAQVLFLKWRPWFPGAESEKSLIKGVRAGVYTFMSHLN